MKLLLTNDDGIDAPGLAALAQAARGFGAVIVVAPDAAHSGCSHRVTSHEVLRLAPKGSGWFALNGTPADCSRIGLTHVLPEADWVLSGINQGGNLGADVYHSGTVAAAREAVLLGRPGAAFSHYQKRGWAIDWTRASRWMVPLLERLLFGPTEPGVYWNVNLPHLEEAAPDPCAIDCLLQPGALPVDYSRTDNEFRYAGNYHQRARDPGRDVDVCFNGNIAVNRLVLHDVS